jgi:hypothetical protein
MSRCRQQRGETRELDAYNVARSLTIKHMGTEAFKDELLPGHLERVLRKERLPKSPDTSDRVQLWINDGWTRHFGNACQTRAQIVVLDAVRNQEMNVGSVGQCLDQVGLTNVAPTAAPVRQYRCHPKDVRHIRLTFSSCSARDELRLH